MTLGELLDELCGNEDSEDYKVLVEMPMGVQEAEYTIKAVRWEHQSREVVLEIDDA